MDYNSETVAAFGKNSAKYAEKYFSLRDYDQYYQLVTATISDGPAKFLDLACGPGNVSAFIRAHRPNAEILCVDRAPEMLEEVLKRVADVKVQIADCRDLGEVADQFDAAAFFFGLSYFDDIDAANVMAELYSVMAPGATLLLATVAGDPELTGVHVNGDGDRVFSFYRRQDDIDKLIRGAGFNVVYSAVIPSPANASVQSSDVVSLCKKL